MCPWDSVTIRWAPPFRSPQSQSARALSKSTSLSTKIWLDGTTPSPRIPSRLRTIVAEGKNIFTALGENRRTVSADEMEKRKKFRRSLVVRRKLERGHVLTEADLDAKRPGTGIAPNEINYVIGRRLASDVVADQVLHWEQSAVSDEERTLNVPVIVIGGGGHAKVLISTLLLQNRNVLGFVDVKPSLSPILGVTRLGDDERCVSSSVGPGTARKWCRFDRFDRFAPGRSMKHFARNNILLRP